MKKVLVTGATGFIGNYVVQQLVQQKCAVIASSANEQKAGTFSWYNQVQYIPFKLEEFDPAVNYYRFFNEPDVMIHLAWEGLPNYKSSFLRIISSLLLLLLKKIYYYTPPCI